jgi:hypothetical protein
MFHPANKVRATIAQKQAEPSESRLNNKETEQQMGDVTFAVARKRSRPYRFVA